MPQGKGVRCWGYLSADGAYAHCTRDDLAGQLPRHPDAQTYAHRLSGPCRCGTTHGETGAGEVRGIGEARGARIVATYDYTDERGALLYQVVRKEPKTFVQRRPDGRGDWIWKGPERAVLYRLLEVLAAVAAGDPVYVVEGEKDADAMGAAGVVATCNHGGAGKWTDAHTEPLKGAEVVIVADRDTAGRDHARKVFAALRDHGGKLRVVEARTGKDAADHLAAGGTPSTFLPVWPIDDLRTHDPVEWKRVVVRRSLEPSDPFRKLNIAKALEGTDEPRWPTGLEGTNYALPNFRGVTILTGAPSSGKSYLAIASAVQAAWAGWDVLYLSSEMSDRVLAQRIRGYAGEHVPETLHVQCVSFGANVTALVDLVAAHIGASNLLVVFDSISSFVDQALEKRGEDDVHQIGPLKQLLMWALNVKRHTEGQVSFLVLSETNREGRTKGRFGDHKADLVVTLESDARNPTSKKLSITKGWEYQTGEMGYYALDWRSGRLRKLGED